MYRFDHENLDVYKLTLEVLRWLHAAEFPRGQASLRDQAIRACGSILLNIAEGRSRGGDAGRNHFRIARGSAAETCAALDAVVLTGGRENQEKLRRIGAMLTGMEKKRQ